MARRDKPAARKDKKRRPPAGAAPAVAPAPVVTVPAPAGAELRSWHHGWRIPAALVLLHVVLALLSFVPAPHTGGDNAAYASLARALLEGRGYVELWDPAVRPHTQFPPVFPALLALGSLVGLEWWVGAKLIVVAFSALAVLFTYLWLRRETTPGVAISAGLFVAFSPGVLELSHWELSDVPFWAFTMLALWAFAHFEERPLVPGGPGADAGAAPRLDARWIAVATGATALAYLTRSAGLPLLLAGAAWLAWRRRWRALGVFGAVAGGLALAWWLRGELAGGSGYLSSFWAVDPYTPSKGTIGIAGLFPRMAANGWKYVSGHLPLLTVNSRFVGKLVALALIGLGITGWARRLRRAGVVELWVPLYVGMTLVWPETWSGERFVLPLLPVLLLYTGEALRDLPPKTDAGAMVALGAAAILYGFSVPGLVKEVRRGTACTAAYLRGDEFACTPAPWRDFLSLARLTRDRLPEGSVVVSRKPTLFYAFSGYPGRVYPLSADPDTFFRAAREARATHVAVDGLVDLTPRYLRPAVLARAERFCWMPEFRLQTAFMMRILPGGGRRAPDGGPPPCQPGGRPPAPLPVRR
ncbi:MAG TPA: hypothetical protein VF746_26095 [Longimicrobium sp.]